MQQVWQLSRLSKLSSLLLLKLLLTCNQELRSMVPCICIGTL